MPDPTPGDQLYRSLMQLHEETFRVGRYELAYHLLAAAFHAAEELENVELLTEVRTEAEGRQRELDGLRPEHRLSTPAAQRRGIHPLYTVLTAIVTAAKGRIAAERTRHRSHQAVFGNDDRGGS